MAAKLYTDVHVPSAVTLGLRIRGIDVLTSQQDGTTEFSDEDLLLQSTALGRILLTQDTDFLTIAAVWQQTGTTFRAVIFVKQLGVGLGQIIEDVDLLLNAATEPELWNQVFHLPFR